MAAGAKLDAILEALEIADDSTSSYFDLETGEVHSITEEEFSLAKNPRKDLPAWQHESVDLACSIRQSEGKRFLLLPGKFEIHEWEIMARFATTLEDAQIRDNFCGGIRGPGAFRRFKELLTKHNLWDSWNQFKQAELRQIAAEWCQEHGICVS